MDLPGLLGGRSRPFTLCHDVRGSFGRLLRSALEGGRVGVALGPIYEQDPAAEILAPFERSARESRWWDLSPEQFAPDHIWERARAVRSEAIVSLASGIDEDRLDEWTRAGLVLEVGSIWGIRVGSRIEHPRWKMKGTVTGRFGVESGGFNPLIIPRMGRHEILPGKGRLMAAIDFGAMDVCSMRSLVPGLDGLLGDGDPYARIAELTDLPRDVAKVSFLAWSYGASVEPRLHSILRRELEPVFEFARPMPHGEFPRLVQETSALAFRAALSRALPLLVGPDLRPMFAVHDELTLDYLSGQEDGLAGVAKAMEEGATQTIGTPYRTKVRFGGRSYMDVK